MRTRLTLLILLLLLDIPLFAQAPFFWRGVYLFELDTASSKQRFFSALADSLHVNVYQVRTFEGAYARDAFFLRNNRGLKVLVQENAVMAALSGAEEGTGIRRALRERVHDERVRRVARNLGSYESVHRFYLRDEPTPEAYAAWSDVHELVKTSGVPSHRAKSVGAIADTGKNIADFLAIARPSELIIDPYFIWNSVPHPSLEGRPALARGAGIRAWEDYPAHEREGWYFGNLQLYLNQALRERIRPAAEAARYGPSPVPWILVPQLHGVLYAATGLYDIDSDPDVTPTLRPPSPAEIRLQYGIGVAYGAKGFLAYPYGTQFTPIEGVGMTANVGLVPQRERDATLVDHGSDMGVVFGREVWCGYREKWGAVAENHLRFRRGLGDTLLGLTWVGAKSWTHATEGGRWVPAEVQTSRWDGRLIARCMVSTAGGYQDGLPQVEMGHLRRGRRGYLVVVNRRCGSRDEAVIAIRFGEGLVDRVVDVEDRRREWRVVGGGELRDRVEPGGWRVYRLDGRFF